jgi:hypothetical protein
MGRATCSKMSVWNLFHINSHDCSKLTQAAVLAKQCGTIWEELSKARFLEYNLNKTAIRFSME